MKKTSYNDFEFIRTLGKGAFSTVYLVKRKADHQQYALKSIIMEKLKENEQQNSVNEIRILASISHNNIIGYKEAFWNEKNKTLNIVMEYCDDGDLETKIKNMKRNRQRFEESLIWNYAIQIIGGLKALHDKKILHRDLKSANIFLKKENNQCKIGDLNVSKVMKDNFLINSQLGTPTYSSPEVWQNKPYSYKSDLWSVGCIIYEMCSLRPPFKGKNYEELCNNICNGKIEKISSRYSNELWEMIKMLLEIDVNKRADCDKILNSDLIKDKKEEFSNIYMENNNYLNDDETSLLETIEYKNLRDLENKIPNKRKYVELSKQIKKNNNIQENIDETIKNDSSFDEFSISEQKPINNINKINTYFINNNSLFSSIKENKDIFKKIQKEGIFKNLLINKSISKSCIFLSLQNSFKDINFEKYELNISKSQKMINNKLIVPIHTDNKYKKINIKYMTSEKQRFKAIKKGKNKITLYKSNDLINNIILIPEDNDSKSGLRSLKEDIARKISQRALPVSSYIKRPGVESHTISNSNPKMIKKNNITKASSSKNTRLDISFKKPHKSLFEKNENNKSEKSKFANQKEKKNIENTENYGRIKSGDASKFSENFKNVNKVRKNIITKKNKIDIKVENSLDKKLIEAKKTGSNSNTKNESSFSGLAKNKIMNSIKKNKMNKERKSFKNEILLEGKIQKSKLSDKNLVSHYPILSAELNINPKVKSFKSNKCVNNLKGNSRIIEIDISNKNNANILKKSFFLESRNPFNNEQKNNNINYTANTSQEIRISKLINKKINKHKDSSKNVSSKFKSNTSGKNP